MLLSFALRAVARIMVGKFEQRQLKAIREKLNRAHAEFLKADGLPWYVSYWVRLGVK